MKQFVFPAILYKDSERRGYTIVVTDVNICTEGVSVEDAFLRAKDFLEVYCRNAIEYNGEVDEATKYEDVEKEKGTIILLVDAVYEDNKKSKKESRFSIEFD